MYVKTLHIFATTRDPMNFRKYFSNIHQKLVIVPKNLTFFERIHHTHFSCIR